MIHIRQIKTGRCVLTLDDDHDTGGRIDVIIEVTDAVEDISPSSRLDVVVLGVPYVGIVGDKVASATMPLLSSCFDSPSVVSAYDHKYDYTIRLVAVEGYDYSELIKFPWSD